MGQSDLVRSLHARQSYGFAGSWRTKLTHISHALSMQVHHYSHEQPACTLKPWEICVSFVRQVPTKEAIAKTM
jgi:hypothetical protein